MTRFAVLLAGVALAAMFPSRSTAQPFQGGGFQIVDAQVEKDKLVWTETKLVPVIKEQAVVRVVDGKMETVFVKVTVLVPTAVTQGLELKAVKATDAAGKDISTEKLAELLKTATPVVFVPGPLEARHRALFKDKTVFIEMSVPKLPGVVPAPPVLAPPPEKP